MLYEVVIIWWWASWLMVAATLLDNGFSWNILLIEKNAKLWEKVLITWWGRCNVTTSINNKKLLLEKFPRWKPFVKYVYWKFPPKKLYNWFEEKWLPLKIEDDFRVFPLSNNSNDVLKVFYDLFKVSNNLDILYSDQVELVDYDGNYFNIKLQSWKKINSKNLVISTWGNAYSHTWSSWQWYEFAKNLWHSITKLWPSLNSFKTNIDFSSISGISFQDSLINYSWLNINWPILFTHFWLTWPWIFSLSSNSAFELISKDQPLKINITFNKLYNNVKIYEFITTSSITNPKKEIANLLSTLYPKRFVEFILNLVDVPKDIKLCYLDKTKKKIISNSFWNFELELIWRKPWDEFVTAWWVSLNNVNINSLESDMVSWLYFAWEVLDVDWLTWWFNLRWCWASWYIVWNSIMNKKE